MGFADEVLPEKSVGNLVRQKASKRTKKHEQGKAGVVFLVGGDDGINLR